MNSNSLALSSPNLLAEYVGQNELTSFFEKRLAAPPDHAAILIRNGQVVDAYKGAHFSVGGLFQGIKNLVTGSHHVRILLADLKPFQAQAAIKAITKDHVEVAGVVTIELQLDPDKPQNILGLINPTGCLARGEAFERFEPHLTDRVFEAVVGRLEASELRGDAGVQDLLQGQVMRELERVAGDIGLHVRAVSVEWALNEVERDSMLCAKLDRDQENLDHDLERLKRQLGRGAEATEFEIRSGVDLAKLNLESDDEVERLVLDKEVELLDARESAQRRQELEALGHEIEVLSVERTARIENELADAGQTIDLQRYSRAKARVNLEIEAMKQTHLREMRKLGAFSELEVEERTKQLDLEISERAQRQSLEHISGLAGIERESDAHEAELREAERDGQSRRSVADIKAEADARVAQLQAGAQMTPEQILAINAGLSKDVAAVLAEQARNQGSGNEQAMSLMRDMVAQATEARVASEQQAREMFRMGIDGAVGVARGAGGTGGGGASGAGEPEVETTSVECSSCGRVNAAKAKFCVGCGNQLRT